MKITISHKHAESRAAVETETSHHLEKLSRLLKPYAPDLVRVHGSFEKHPRKIEYTFSLNLSLPTGTLHSTGVGPDVRKCIKEAFAELSAQLKKHKSLLRHDYQWKRKRPRAALRA
jgi:ribosome-associated translation inhibitor RaiA